MSHFRLLRPVGTVAVALLSLSAFGQQRYSQLETYANEYSSREVVSSNTGSALVSVRQGGGDYAQASATADYGVLKVRTFVDSAGDGYLFARAVAEAKMEDRLLIEAPGLSGTAGSFDLRYRLHAEWFARTPNGGVGGYQNINTIRFGIGASRDPASSPALISGGDQLLYDDFYSVSDGTSVGGGNINGMFTHRLHFVYGQPFYLSMALRGKNAVSDFRDAPFTAAVIADNTASLQGIPAIYDTNGNPVTGASVTSASGTNYAVPEPASMAVLGLGLAAFKRRRRS